MIDAHFHIWRLARGDYGWLTAQQGAIFRDVALDDWRRISAPCGITGGILVQAAPTEAETRFLLQQTQDTSDVLGVVGWVDMLVPDAALRIKELAKNTRLKGLRPMLQDIADPNWILQTALHSGFDAMLACDLAFDALVKPDHLPRMLKLARRYPDLRIVIDHGAKPDIANGQWQDWASDLERLAQAPQVYCKLSGLWTEASRGTGVAALAPYMRHIEKCFGTRKMLWGSDWPVLELAGTYPAWHAAAYEHTAASDRGAVFEAVARQVYRLEQTQRIARPI